MQEPSKVLLWSINGIVPRPLDCAIIVNEPYWLHCSPRTFSVYGNYGNYGSIVVDWDIYHLENRIWRSPSS